jgi:pimeloyl-ACP methyl ester carboxylesterase
VKALWIDFAKAYVRYMDVFHAQPSLVFLHGLGSSSIADFTEVVTLEVLGARRSLLIDLLGFGYSDRPIDFGYTLNDHAEVVARVLTRLAIDSAVIVGHSMGGSVAIALAHSHPELVSRLILLESNLDPGVGGGSRHIASQPEAEYIGTGHAEFLAGLRANIEKEPSNAVFAGAFAASAPYAVHRSAVGLLEGTKPPQRVALAALSIPKYYLVGERNLGEFNVSHLEALGMSVIAVPESGHAMMDDNPEGLAAALAQAARW